MDRLSRPKWWNANQSWHYEAFWKVGDETIKVEIKRNAHDFQSGAKASALQRSDGPRWEVLVDHDYPLLAVCRQKRVSGTYAFGPREDYRYHVPAISYTAQTLGPAELRLFEMDETALMAEVALLLGDPQAEELRLAVERLFPAAP